MKDVLDIKECKVSRKATSISIGRTAVRPQFDTLVAIPSITATPEQLGIIAAMCGKVLDRLGEAAQYVEVMKATLYVSSSEELFFEIRAIVSIYGGPDRKKKESVPTRVPLKNGVLRSTNAIEQLYAAIVAEMGAFVREFEENAQFWRTKLPV